MARVTCNNEREGIFIGTCLGASCSFERGQSHNCDPSFSNHHLRINPIVISSRHQTHEKLGTRAFIKIRLYRNLNVNSIVIMIPLQNLPSWSFHRCHYPRENGRCSGFDCCSVLPPPPTGDESQPQAPTGCAGGGRERLCGR